MYYYIDVVHQKKNPYVYPYAYMNLNPEGVEFHTASDFKDFLWES